MKAKSSSWNQIIPYFVAAIATAYLIYVLVVQGDSLQYIHFWIFLLIVVLVLAPLAGRLKIWNLIDFNSKFESLRTETKEEIGQIRSQITSIVQTSVTPMQHQWTVLGVDEQITRKLAESIAEQFQLVPSSHDLEDIKKADPARIRFLRTADYYRSCAYNVLSIAFMFQIAILEHRKPTAADISSGSTDDQIGHMLKHILDGGVKLFVPSEEVARITEELKDIAKLLDLCKSVDSKEAEVPSEQETNQLFGNVHSGLGGIWAGIIINGSQAFIAQQNIMQMLEEWKKA
jgi:hypothetical protein